jgi:hypothetical protein
MKAKIHLSPLRVVGYQKAYPLMEHIIKTHWLFMSILKLSTLIDYYPISLNSFICVPCNMFYRTTSLVK